MITKNNSNINAYEVLGLIQMLITKPKVDIPCTSDRTATNASICSKIVLNNDRRSGTRTIIPECSGIDCEECPLNLPIKGLNHEP